MIHYYLLLAREHGETEAEPLVASFGDPSAVRQAYREIIGPRSSEFTAEYGELLFVEDGRVIAHHQYPNPVAVEKARKQKVLSAARKAVAEHDAAKAAFGAASKRMSEARDLIKELTPEQQVLIDADNAERAAREKAEGEKKAASDAKAAGEKAAREKNEADAEAARKTALDVAREAAEALKDAVPPPPPIPAAGGSSTSSSSSSSSSSGTPLPPPGMAPAK